MMPIMKQHNAILDRYTGITGGWYDDDTTKTQEFHVWLKVGVQTFRVTQAPFDDREEAEAFREMLATALLTVVREQKEEK